METQFETPFEECLADFVLEWCGKDAQEDLSAFKEWATEIFANAHIATPCWRRTAETKNGLVKTESGEIALVQYGYYVMLDDLVARLPIEY